MIDAVIIFVKCVLIIGFGAVALSLELAVISFVIYAVGLGYVDYKKYINKGL